eukprot:8217759-Pyramimonas_sp.AAC.1
MAAPMSFFSVALSASYLNSLAVALPVSSASRSRVEVDLVRVLRLLEALGHIVQEILALGSALAGVELALAVTSQCHWRVPPLNLALRLGAAL